MQTWTAAVLCAALAFVPRPAAAHSRYRYRGPSPFVARLDLGASKLGLANTRFVGDPSRGGRSSPVALTGRQVGLDRPLLFDASVHVAYQAHHLTLGMVVGMMNGSFNRRAPDGAPAGQALMVDGSLGGEYGGPEVGTSWSNRYVDFHAGISVGYQRMSVGLTGYDPVPCGRGSTCQPDVHSDQFYVRPVASIGFHHKWFIAGAYVGGDAMPDGGWSAGGYIGINGDSERTQSLVANAPPLPL